MGSPRFRVTNNTLKFHASEWKCLYDGLYIIALNSRAVKIMVEHKLKRK